MHIACERYRKEIPLRNRKEVSRVTLALVALAAVIASCVPAPTAKTWSYVGRSADGYEVVYRLNRGSPSTVCFPSRIRIGSGTRNGVIKVTGLQPGDQVRPQYTTSGWTGGIVFAVNGRRLGVLPPGNQVSTNVAFRNQQVRTSNDLCRYFSLRKGDQLIRT